jgi:hypothetical protein
LKEFEMKSGKLLKFSAKFKVIPEEARVDIIFILI